MTKLSPKALRLMRNAIRTAINESWAGADPFGYHPEIRQEARDSLIKLRVYIAELEQDRQTLRNIVKKA